MSALLFHPNGVQFKPHRDIPDLTGKVILVTGGTGGIGRTTISNLVTHNPGHIIFTGRNEKRAGEVIDAARKASPTVKLTFLTCDQASLDSVEGVAKQILTKFDRLDIVFANAGIMGVPPGLTKDGYEIQFGTNHMGHALLLKYLLPLMASTADRGHDVRLITITSSAFKASPQIAYQSIKTPQNMFMGH